MSDKMGKVMFYANLYYGRPYLREIIVKETAKQWRVLSETNLYGDPGYIMDCYVGRRFNRGARRVLPTRLAAIHYLIHELSDHVQSLSIQHHRAERELNELRDLVVAETVTAADALAEPAPAE